ncbi:HAD family hydrolase [Swaminathania salitolerans]|uniref:Glycerol-3-phosphatase n=1 Tax=Swaminathania salitolerans TaxID=182838 RepID=A0A511BZ09_9PROT|nr:HAD family hydrolase [Swaminathania salitolerans]GBQ13230.1 putative phosphatase [Swaminathania salitolerans LMG 21291]GEL03248.1 glycerol-3-phosphatase [Swaminathania salitolerans]
MTEHDLFPGKAFDAFLFDMDGTILTSIIAAERVWTLWAQKHGLDVGKFLATIHGVQTIETIRRQNLPGVDPVEEARWVTSREMEDTQGIDPIPGAIAFLNSLPADRWAIVTSASRDLALRRIRTAGLPLPGLLITAEDAPNGKPAPDCFLLGAQRLGFEAKNCVVFEDAPAGIRAGEAAGASVVVITTTHTHAVDVPHPTVPGYEALEARRMADGRLSLLGRDTA